LGTDLKRELLRLLDEDEEFRYAVAGRIGILEILKRLDRLEDNQNKLWENQNRLWEEVRSLREGQEKLWRGQEKLWENVEKLWAEVKNLREGQEKLWEEVRSLREGQNKLWEGQNKLWEEVRSLREGQNKLWVEVKELKKAYQGLSKKVSAGFAELGSALGVTYEMHAAAYVQVLLEELGYPGAKVTRGWALKDGEVLEIDIFCDEPLVVGEVTTRLRDEAEMDREINKLMERVEAVSSKYGKKPFLVILSVGVAPDSLVERLREETEKHGIKLVLGREIEEELSA
ncbi:MAG: hypothetical protein QXS12_02050, partial [Candidatus Caldarchaeum sp.]